MSKGVAPATCCVKADSHSGALQRWLAACCVVSIWTFSSVCCRLADPPNTELMLLSLPVERGEHSPLVRVVISAPVVESLETIGRRVSLFGRLLDEHALKPETVENKG